MTKEPPDYPNTLRLNNTMLKNQWVTEVIREEIKYLLECNENTIYHNPWDTAEERGKFIAISAYIKKT
jgi:hypothetical protein